MTETTELKCKICGEQMIARIDSVKSIAYIYCPSMLHDHNIYVVPLVG